MYLISILILSSCQVADVQNGTEKKDNFLQEVGRLSDFVLSQSKVGGYLSEEDAVILDNWLKELSTRYDFQNNFDYCGDIYTRSDYEPDFYDYLNWIEENATSGFYQIIYRWLVDEEFDDDLNQILANTILLPNEQVAIAVVYPLVQNSLVEFESRGGVDQCYDQYNSDWPSSPLPAADAVLGRSRRPACRSPVCSSRRSRRRASRPRSSATTCAGTIGIASISPIPCSSARPIPRKWSRPMPGGWP